MKTLSLVLMMLALGAASPLNEAAAQTPTCDALAPGPKAVAQAVLDAQHPYDCCDDTIARCLSGATPSTCDLPRRLADHVCRLAGEGKERAAIVRSLERRALTMMRPGRVFAIDTSDSAVAGAAGAPVVLVAYLCLTCPYCGRLLPLLHREVLTGRLAGKVALYVRLFPIRGHTHATEGSLAVAAAHTLGKFWDYLLHGYANHRDLSEEVLPRWAAAVGLDPAAFEAAMKRPEVRSWLVESKKEGLRNDVDATPTLFINGRRYVADLDLDTLVDLVLEEHDATR